MDTKALLNSLEKEIRNNENSLQQDQQLLRLQSIAAQYEGDDRVISTTELLEEIKNTPIKEKFFSGFKDLDIKMEGFVTGENIFLTGITKHGKTSFCMELSVRFREQNPLWLSFEERAIDLLRKFHSKTGEYPLFFTPRKNERPNLEWIETKIVEAKAKFDSKVVFIDHIGFLSDAERGKDDTEASRLERISRTIHSLAVKWDVLIFLMGHLTKVRSDQNPDIENIKGSSAMAQESDLTMLIWRKTHREGEKVIIENVTNLSLQANRRGQTGNIEFIYRGGHFLEETWDLPANEESWQ
ncbi:MAG TPA: DnaB-like helicase C-terminal domain-containing protein [Methylomirabilota bacterium]|nr:DnaB-like helicase C-terminal domain-containing protein [Methylomirabilota bacterium]